MSSNNQVHRAPPKVRQSFKEPPLVESAASPLVVILDDHPDNLMLLAYSLESWNVRCLTFQTARELFSEIRSIEPDILLVDIKLPDIDGFEVFKIIRQGYRLEHVPIIAMTALCDPEAQHKIQSKGFADYLRKPFKLEQLKTLLLKHLDDKNQQACQNRVA